MKNPEYREVGAITEVNVYTPESGKGARAGAPSLVSSAPSTGRGTGAQRLPAAILRADLSLFFYHLYKITSYVQLYYRAFCMQINYLFSTHFPI